MANGNLHSIEQGSLVCKMMLTVKHDSREEVLWHENLVIIVVQNDGYMTRVWKVGNMATKIMKLVVYNVAWAEAYLRTKWHFHPSSRLATIDTGRK